MKSLLVVVVLTLSASSVAGQIVSAPSALGGRVGSATIQGDTLFVAGTFLGVSPTAEARGRFAVVDTVAGARAVDTPYVYGSVPGDVRVVVSDGQGGAFIGGHFAKVGQTARLALAHIRADGTLDQSFAPAVTYSGGPGSPGFVSALVLSGNTLYIGGFFDRVNNQSRMSLAAVDAATGTLLPWAPTVADQGGLAWVYALAATDTTLFAGGTFTTINGATRSSLAAIDLVTGQLSSWSADTMSILTRGEVRRLKVRGSLLYIAGLFSSVNHVDRRGAAAVSVTTGQVTPWDPSINGACYGLDFVGDIAILGGSFNLLGLSRQIRTPRSNIAAVDLGAGDPLPWSPSVDGPVSTLTVSGSTIFAGGYFARVHEVDRAGAASFDWPSGNVGPWNPSMNGHVFALSVDSGRVFLGGEFSSIKAAVRPRLAAINITTGRVTDWRPLPLASGVCYPQAVTTNDARVFLGGTYCGFLAFDRHTGNRVEWNHGASTDDTRIRALAVHGSSVYAQGYFGLPDRLGLIAFDTTTAAVLPWDPEPYPSGSLNQILPVDGSVYLAGVFTVTGHPSTWLLASLDAVTGALRSSRIDFNYTSSEQLYAVSRVGNTLFGAGRFNSANGLTRSNAVAIDVLSNTVTSWTPPTTLGSAFAITATPEFIYVGGALQSPSGQNRNLMAISPSGALAAWQPSPDESVWKLLSTPNAIVALGSFSMMGDVIAPGLAFLSPATVPTPPGSPVNLRAQATDRRLTLDWQAPSSGGPPTAYIVEIGTASGRSDVLRTDSTTVRYITPQLATGAYFVRVRGRNAAGDGPPSNEIITSIVGPPPPPGVPDPPRNLAAAAVGNQLTLTWQPAAGGTPAASYLIAAALSPGGPAIASAPLTTLSLQIAAPTGVFYLTVRGVNEHGTGAPSNEVRVVVGGIGEPPGPPTLSATQVTQNPITVSWSAGGGNAPQSYAVLAGTSSGSSNLGIFNMGLANSVTAIAPTGVRLYLRVAAQNASGAATSNEISFMVSPPPPPVAPVMQPPIVNGSTVQLSWTGSSPGTTYALLARLTPGGPILVTAPVGSVTSLTVPGVASGTYYVSAVAQSGGQTSAESNQVVVTVR